MNVSDIDQLVGVKGRVVPPGRLDCRISVATRAPPQRAAVDAGACNQCFRLLAFQAHCKQVQVVPSISVRRLDEQTLRRLRVQAAHRGVSMEEEARRILRAGVKPRARLGDLALELFGPQYGVDLDIPVRMPHDPVKFDV